jgi:hypothetical protein
MSGRGRYQGRGSYRGGRGQTSRSGRSGKAVQEKKTTGTASSSSTTELKFIPHYSGKQQTVTYDTVKDHIIILIQKTYKHGSDIAQAIREGADPAEIGEGEPERELVTLPEGILSDKEQFRLTLQQNGYDIEYKEALRKYNLQCDVYKDNKIKAFALIFSFCNKIMQNRIEEISDYETRVRDNPFELLAEIKRKMYDPARAKYEFVTLTESLRRILDCKQLEDESLVDYTKKFKQARDIMKDSVGDEILHKFVEKTSAYQAAAGDAATEQELKAKSFGRWTTYLYLMNSDQ